MVLVRVPRVVSTTVMLRRVGPKKKKAHSKKLVKKALRVQAHKKKKKR